MNEFQRRLLDIVQFTYPLGQFADPAREIACIDNYAYSIDWHGPPGTGLTFAAPKTFDLVMDSDSDFVMTYISGGACSEFNNPQEKVKFNPAVLVQITDRSTGRTYFNQPTPMPLIAGMNGFPFLLTSPRVIQPRTTLRVDFTCPNNDASSRGYPSGFFALHGAKIFYK